MDVSVTAYEVTRCSPWAVRNMRFTVDSQIGSISVKDSDGIEEAIVGALKEADCSRQALVVLSAVSHFYCSINSFPTSVQPDSTYLTLTRQHDL